MGHRFDSRRPQSGLLFHKNALRQFSNRFKKYFQVRQKIETHAYSRTDANLTITEEIVTTSVFGSIPGKGKNRPLKYIAVDINYFFGALNDMIERYCFVVLLQLGYKDEKKMLEAHHVPGFESGAHRNFSRTNIWEKKDAV